MKKDNLHNESDVFLAQWLEGNLSDQELKLLVSQEDYNAYIKLRKGLEVNERLNASIDDSLVAIQDRIENKQSNVKPLFRNWSVGVAASIIVLIGLFTLLPNSEVLVQTGFGENQTITLLDGSEVILNAKSSLSYDEDNWLKDRKLQLTGEAYFKVAKGETFEVQTENGSVTVLGTQFNVNSSKDYFDVVCYEGKVSVRTLDQEFILLPNDGVRAVEGKTTNKSKVKGTAPSWIKGESTFRSVPLKKVIEALEKQYNINIDDEEISNQDIFTGSFPHDSLNIALKTVFETLNVTVIYNEKEKRNIKLRYKE